MLSVVTGNTTSKNAALKSAVDKGLIQKEREGRKNIYWGDSTRHQNHNSEIIADHVKGLSGAEHDAATQQLVLGQ